MVCRLACVQKNLSYQNIFSEFLEKENMYVYIIHSVEHMETCGVIAVRTGSHVICDFLSQVGLSDEDFGDFLTGSVKNTCHQRVFIVPQSGSLCKITEGETE